MTKQPTAPDDPSPDSETLSAPAIDNLYKVAPVGLIVAAVVLFVLFILFTILAIGKIDFTRLKEAAATDNSAATSTEPPPQNTAVKVNTADAKKVSDDYIADLQQGKTDAALSLETADFQGGKDHQPWLLPPSLYVPAGATTVYDKADTKTVSGEPDYVI